MKCAFGGSFITLPGYLKYLALNGTNVPNRFETYCHWVANLLPAQFRVGLKQMYYWGTSTIYQF
jgi:hypothetical protein